MNMKVSVCIPVYNGEQYIERTIQSVLDQTFTEYELLVIDNCSTDNTIDKVRNFKDSRIHLIQNERNYGMFGNWNICLHRAQGEYIHLLCADDSLQPECLEKQLNILETHKDIVFVFNASNVVDEQDKNIMKRRPFHKDMICDGKWLARKSFRTHNLFGEPSNVLFRRSSSELVGEFSSEVCYSSDWDYWMRLSMEGNVAYIDECLTNFRVSTISGTSQLLKQKEKLKKDDKVLIDRVKQNPKFKVTKSDIAIHSIAIKMRLYAKMFFCLLTKKN